VIFPLLQVKSRCISSDYYIRKKEDTWCREETDFFGESFAIEGIF